MHTDQQHAAAIHMKKVGGGFASRLAEAYLYADGGNQYRIYRAFEDLFKRHLPTEEKQMSNLTVGTLDNGAVVVNISTDSASKTIGGTSTPDGGYVMVEYVKAGWIQITVFNDEGDVLLEREYDTVAHPEVKLREV
jgi:hypothetical protein